MGGRGGARALRVLTLPRSVRVWLAAEPVHMGKQHDGLAALVKEQFGEDPFSGNLYVFVGKRRDRCKVLWWEPGGYVVYYKRFDRHRLRLPPVVAGTGRIVLDGAQLAMLLDGIDLNGVRRPTHWQPRRRIDKRAAM